MFRSKDRATLEAMVADARALLTGQEKIMSAIADLQTAAAAIKAAIASAVTLIQGFVNGTVNADDPQVEAVVADLNAAAAALSGAATPAAAPASHKK